MSELHKITEKGNTASLECQTYTDHSRGWNVLLKHTQTDKIIVRIACRNELQAKTLFAIMNDSCYTEIFEGKDDLWRTEKIL